MNPSPPPEGITTPPVRNYVTPTDSVTTPPVRNYDITEYLQDNLTDSLQESTLAAEAALASEQPKEKTEKAGKEKSEAGPPRSETIAHTICIEIWMQFVKAESGIRPIWKGNEGGKEGLAMKEIIAKIMPLAKDKLLEPAFNPKYIETVAVKETLLDTSRINATSLAASEYDGLARQTCHIFAYILNATDKVDPFFTKNLTLAFLNANLVSILKELKNGKPQSKSKGFVEPEPDKLNTALSTVNADGYQRRF